MPRYVVVAAAIQLLTTPIAFCVVAAGSYRTDYGLTCFAVAQVIAFVVFWIGLYRQLDRDVGKAMFLALYATLALLPVSILMIFCVAFVGWAIELACHRCGFSMPAY
jgi:hypothetical protein